jgi:arylsulfatase A
LIPEPKRISAMKGSLSIASVVALIAILDAPAAAADAAAAGPPSFVFILADDLGAHDLGYSGSDLHRTPGIDRLAREGMIFTAAYAACTVCSPSRAAILTGKYPARLHLTDWIHGHDRPRAKLLPPEWTQFLDPAETTVAESLRAAGYATAQIGKWHLGDGEEHRPERQGFNRCRAGTGKGQPPSYFSPYKIPTLEDGPPGEYLTDREAAEACRFIEENRARPFFLYLAHHAVHTPLQAKADRIEECRKRLRPGLRHANPTYAAMVEGLDDAVGRVLAKLDELGIAGRTAVIFTSDNGGLIGGPKNPVTSNFPLRAGKGSHFEGGHRVPLVVRWPGTVPAGSRCDRPVTGVDFFPTVLEAAGRGADLAGRRNLDGKSLLPLLRDPAARWDREAIYWHYPHYHPGGATPYGAVRNGDWKLVERFEDGGLELYDLRSDPGETRDLAGSEKERAGRLREMLAVWRKDVGAQMPRPNPIAEAADPGVAAPAPPAFSIRLPGEKLGFPGAEYWAEIERPDGTIARAFARHVEGDSWTMPIPADAAGAYRIVKVVRMREGREEAVPLGEGGQARVEVRRPARALAAQEQVLVETGQFEVFFAAEEPWCINDHSLVQGPDGTWHLFGITHPKPFDFAKDPGRSLAHAVSPSLLERPWRALPPAVTADPERHHEFFFWAPHVIRHEGLYWMFVCAGERDGHRYRIHLLTSPDLAAWTRHPGNPLVIDGFDGRDPMVLPLGGRWAMYYTATSGPDGGNHIVAALTSTDLVRWSDRRVVFVHPRTGTFGGPTESPFVVHRGDRFYLFACDGGHTDVYVSRDPFRWEIEGRAGRIASHASEVVRDAGGRWWITHAGWMNGPVSMAPLLWRDGLDGAETSVPVAKAPEDRAGGKRTADPEAVREVLAGKRTEADASWWGFDEEDATRALQGAISSGAKKVVVPFLGKDWIVEPITLAGDQEILFEPGVVVSAKKGSFRGKNDCLFRADRKRNVALVGYGAALRMRKEDYTGPGYEKAEWRHVLEFTSCEGVRVLGLTLARSGGDGIYVGQNDAARPYSKDVLIRDVTCTGNHRQGISVITAEDLTIEHCILEGTSGTPPAAGIDFEPNLPGERLIDCRVRDCTFRANAGAGVQIYLGPLVAESRPVSIEVSSCLVEDNVGPGLWVGGMERGAPGRIAFTRCTVLRNRQQGAFLGKLAAGATVRLEGCSFHDVAKASPRMAPIAIGAGDRLGGIEIEGCRLFDEADRPAIAPATFTGTLYLYRKGKLSELTPNIR